MEKSVVVVLIILLLGLVLFFTLSYILAFSPEEKAYIKATWSFGDSIEVENRDLSQGEVKADAGTQTGIEEDRRFKAPQIPTN